jgi:hypothetical protein
VSNLPFGSEGLISISVQRLTCPRQRPFGPSHQGWYPASYPRRSTEGPTCRRGFLPPFGHRHSLLGHPVPPRNSAPLTVGLPGVHLDPGGVSTFRTSESRPDWVPSLPRGPAVLSRPVRSLRPPLAPSPRGQALSPRSSSHLRSYPLRGVIKGSLAFTRPAFPLAWLFPRMEQGPLGSLPGLRTPTGKTCGARRSGGRASSTRPESHDRHRRTSYP